MKTYNYDSFNANTFISDSTEVVGKGNVKMKKRIFLTFDMEWANDEVLNWFYEILCKYDIRGTINVTHRTKLIEEWRKEGRLEFGIHPNFNKFLSGDGTGNFKTVIKDLKEIVPDAITVRSHSLVSSNVLSKAFSEFGFKYESNTFITPNCSINIFPQIDVFGLTQVPIVFEDDLFLASGQNTLPSWYLDNLNMELVFNFHPIHLFLNTDNMQRYELAKVYNSDYRRLKEYVNSKNNGIFNFFENLVRYAKENQYEFSWIKEL